MSWNYRIVRYKNGSGFGLHEVYYDEHGRACAMTEAPAGFVGDPGEGPTEIIEALLMARIDARERPIFEEPEKWDA